MSTPEEKEKLRIETISKLSIGGTDRSGRSISNIYVKADEFVIYSTDANGAIEDIAIYIDAEDPDEEIKIINNFQQVKGDFDKLKAISNHCSNQSYSARASHALSVAIYGDPDKARNILKEIFNNIEDEYKEKVIGKLIYISGAFLVTISMGCLSLYLYLIQPIFIVIERQAIYELILVCSLATMGGLISVSKNLNKINVDKGLGKLPYFVYGIERNIFSIVGGIFIFLLMKSNLLFGFVSSLDNHLYGYLVFGFLAGFSETLIPNALKNLEKRANKESNK